MDCSGSVTAIYSKWLDHWMSKLVIHSPSYLKDSQDLLDRIKNLGALPSHARVFTADAVSMYTNIDTDKAIEAIRIWIERYRVELHENFPPAALFLQVLEVIMNNSIFTFGDTYFRQKAGTVMGTSCACMYATLFYGLHERITLLPETADLVPLLCRFIDDIFGVWVDPALPPRLTAAQETAWFLGNARW